MTLSLTIDASIICVSAKDSSYNTIKKLLDCLYSNKHKIVIDKYDKKILKEYRNCVRGYNKEWLTQMILKKRYIKIDIKNKSLPKGIIKDKYDKKYILVCLNSPDKILMSKDRHFFESSCLHFLKKNKCRCLSAPESLLYIKC